MHNLVENPEALGFHQEQTEMTEDSTEIPGLVLYQTLYYLLSIFHSKFSKVEDKRKEKVLPTSFSYNTKIQIQSHYFNVSGNIIK